MTTPTYATNAQIDEAVLELIRQNQPITNGFLAGRLYYRCALRPNKGNRYSTASEHTTRSCQRLKQRGLVKFDKGWRVA